LANEQASNPFLKSTGGIEVSQLPGWEDANGIYGLNTLWNGSKYNAPWQDEPDHPGYSLAWGDFLADDWFTTDPADGSAIPGQIRLTDYDPPTPDPTPSAVSGAGPGEILYQGEQIATLLPGFNDQLIKIWRPLGGARKISLLAKPLAGWEPTPDELKSWATNCLSVPIVVEWEIK
jgi:hypothetical protein